MWKTNTKDPGNPLTTKETPEQVREHVKLTEKNHSLPKTVSIAGKPSHTKSHGDRQETDPQKPRQKQADNNRGRKSAPRRKTKNNTEP
jgi:hypothetical protein